MRSLVIALSICFVLGAQLRRLGAEQKPTTVAGQWNVTIRMPGRTVSEQWIIRQKGAAVTGTTKTEHGEFPVSGTVEGAFFRVTVQDGRKQYKVRATVDGDAMDGSITLGVGDARLWFAKRAAASTK
jgi:hypothetical protein